MSASERLRALHAIQLQEGRWPNFPDYEGDIYLAALPLIADVVEAAETLDYFPRFSKPLAALKRHLEDGDIT